MIHLWNAGDTDPQGIMRQAVHSQDLTRVFAGAKK